MTFIKPFDSYDELANFQALEKEITDSKVEKGCEMENIEIEYYDEEFPYIIISNVFNTEERIRLVWEELDFLCYNWKDLSHLNRQIPGKWDINDLPNRKEVFLERVYNSPIFSNIIKVYNEIFGKNIEYIENLFSKHNSWFFKEALILSKDHLLNYYEDRNYYRPHKDEGLMTCLHWMFKEPKKFEGGDFIFPDFNKKIEIENNKMIIFPSMIKHEVTPITMEAKDMNKKLGRWCISTFLGSSSKRR